MDSCVFKIENNINKKTYYAATGNLKKCMADYELWLNKGTHGNNELQSDFTKQKGIGFTFAIVHYTKDLQEAFKLKEQFLKLNSNTYNR